MYKKQTATVVALAAALLAGLWWVHPMAAGEWAAWVQAFGVLAAIGWSVHLQSQAATHGMRQAGQVAVVFAANMHWVFRELSDACLKHDASDYLVTRRILEEILAQGREVPLQMLDGRSLAMVTSVRAIGVEALEVIESHHVQDHWRYLHNYFDKRLPSISAWLSATGNPPEASGPTDYIGLRTSAGTVGGH
jgi:hypothetical protein